MNRFSPILGLFVFLSLVGIDAFGQENSTEDFGISIETDEKLIETLTPMLPFIGIIIVIVVVAIILVLKRVNRNDDDYEDDEVDDDSEMLDSLMEEKFQKIQTGTESDNTDALDPDFLIQNKVRMISKLQENKIGDHERLEEIKKTLVDFGSFTQADNEYLEEQFKEYEKIAEHNSEEK